MPSHIGHLALAVPRASRYNQKHKQIKMECWIKNYLIGTPSYTLAQGITAVAETHSATGPNLKYPTTHHQTTGRIKEAYRGPHTNGSHPYDDGDDLPLGKDAHRL